MLILNYKHVRTAGFRVSDVSLFIKDPFGKVKTTPKIEKLRKLFLKVWRLAELGGTLKTTPKKYILHFWMKVFFYLSENF